MNTANNQDTNAENPMSSVGKICNEKVTNALNGSVVLQSYVLFEVVRQLDLLIVLPVDSYAITKFLHRNGINCRYIGRLYHMSSVFHVRQLLLCEAIARVVKCILRDLLRHITRHGKAETFIAEKRRRSKESHFYDHQEKLAEAKSVAVTDMFNLVLGCSKMSTEFWNGKLGYKNKLC